jgi:hypothetical protein
MTASQSPLDHSFALITMHASSIARFPAAVVLAACCAAGLAFSVPAWAQPADPCSTHQLGLDVDGSRFLLRHQSCSADDQPEIEGPSPRRPLLNSNLLERLLELRPLVQRELSVQR